LILTDVNVLVYAHRKDAVNHEQYRQWLNDVMQSPSTFGVSDLALSGFLRIVTHRKIFVDPTPLTTALAFSNQIRAHPNCFVVAPSERHWTIFEQLVRAVGAKGNLIPDAYFAALAIESGAEWITTDRDYARFPGLKWRHPLDDA
jgi:uncharacterized protein